MKLALPLLLTAAILVGCSGSHRDEKAGSLGLMSSNVEADEAFGDIPEEVITEDISNDVIRVQQPDKIIKEANIKFEVDDYKTSKQAIDSLVKRWGGYISSEDEYYSNTRVENAIIIRVHNTQFENLLTQLGETSKKIDYKTVNSIDVTEEYVDLTTRIKTKKEVEQRYIAILKKATKIEDILKVENEIRKIREEIEAKEGRLKYLEDRVSLSTINLNIYQTLQYKYQPKKENGFFTRVYKGLDKGWSGFLSFIVGLAYIWPLYLIGFFAYLIIRQIRKKRRAKK